MRSPILAIIISLATFISLYGQENKLIRATLEALTYRNVGPTRGGRVTTVTGHPDSTNLFYMGATGGGVWKTDDSGISWSNISDGYFATGSIGSISLAPSQPSTIYVGTGSDGLRSNVIIGKGIYGSKDDGKSWQHLGLEDAGQITSIIIHPEDPLHIWAACLGNPFRDNPERGIYESKDGGQSWERTFFISEKTGAVDLEFHPTDPNTIYACMWEARRKPWNIISGGYEGGLFRSTDGGSTWHKLTSGLPGGLIGKSDLAVSPAEPDHIWALIEAPEGEGGVYLSENRGDSFTLISTKEELLDRPFYYCNIDANPQNANSIFVSATQFWHSTDGGKSWDRLSTPHGDHHDLWIHPSDTAIWVQGNDGGVCITRDYGQNWSSIENQSTAELYQVHVDDQFPYWLYAGQQDNTTIAVPSHPPYASVLDARGYWLAVGGCETGPAVPKPGDPDIVYANCKGRFGVYNKRTGQEKQYHVGASNMYGHNPRDLTYRFQRVSPIHVSPHDPQIVYHASQYLHRTRDEGLTWQTISPDLTAFTPETQVISGTPITRDITGEEFFSTLYAVQESPLQPGVIWAGANDGPIHVSRNGGQSWTDVTPSSLPPYGRVQTIEASPHSAGKAYIAVYRYLLGDFKPYIYKTEDFGDTWTLLTNGENGIPGDYPTRVIREDPVQAGLLYAGTEFGMFISFNDGQSWLTFQQNLPVTPITDIKVVHGDLVLSTMGRGFWIIDDICPLHQVGDISEKIILFQPKTAHRYRYRSTNEDAVPYYPGPGMEICYHLGEDASEGIRIEIYNETGKQVQVFDSLDPEEGSEKETDMQTGFGYKTSAVQVSSEPGTHRIRWNLRHKGIESRSGRTIPGPMVVPGQYRIQLVSGQTTTMTRVEVALDPRLVASGVTLEDLQLQEAMSLQLQQMQIEANKLAKWVESQEQAEAKDESGKWVEVKDRLLTQEGRYQQPMLLAQLSYLYSMLNQADQRPGQDAVQQLEVLNKELQALKKLANTPGQME